MRNDKLPMKYYKYLEPTSVSHPDLIYLESHQGQATRQVRFDGTRYRASNSYYPGHAMDLPSCAIDYDAVPGVTAINQTEFEQIWQAHLALRLNRWIAIKRAYPLGTAVTGTICVFYPQGVLAFLGGDTLGLADEATCRASTRPEYLYTGHRLNAVVEGYREPDQWLILAEPHVLAERVDLFELR